MTRSVLLNNVAHHDLCIVTERGAAWGDGVMSAVIFPNEFRQAQAHYPIAFEKTADGTGFQALALFGLAPGQNLFLGPQGWDARWLPMSIERQPFLIGVDGQELLVHVDMDSPRVGISGGEPVFLPHGGTTEFLDRMTSLLLEIHEGVQSMPAFVDALLEHGLLESCVFDGEFADGTQARLAGLYTIDEDRLSALPGAALEQLNRAGYLAPVYMALASQSRFRDLVERLDRIAGSAPKGDASA
jgi:hypothetical protein